MGITFVLVVLNIGFSAAYNRCPGSGGVTWVADEHNCVDFYVCMAGIQIRYSCPPGTVTNADSKSCVPKGSWLDTCKEKKPRPQEIETPTSVKEVVVNETTTATSMPTTITTSSTPSVAATVTTTTAEPKTICELVDRNMLPVETNCAQYIDCSVKSAPVAGECQYPMLFHEKEEKCVSHAISVCGTRKEPKSPCEYNANKCTSSHCVPCEVRFPSCLELPDGPNPWNGREWTPYFVVCSKERVMYQGSCSDEVSISKVFHPNKRMCIDVKELAMSL